MKKTILLLLSTLVFLSVLSACGNTSSSAKDERKNLVLGATIPYSDMLEEGVKPYLEKKGYKVTIIVFNDYVQPNIALNNGSLDANLFQHEVYMTAFAKEHNMNLSSIITVPTAPIGIYSKKYKSLDDIKKGSTIAIANDPTNLAKDLTVLNNNGLIKLGANVDPLKATVNDIASNPLDLQFKPVDAAQLPRTLDSVDLAAINGNFAVSAGIDLNSALVKDKLTEQFLDTLVVKTDDKNKQYVKDIKAAIQSQQFKKVIQEKFKGFQLPDWMK